MSVLEQVFSELEEKAEKISVELSAINSLANVVSVAAENGASAQEISNAMLGLSYISQSTQSTAEALSCRIAVRKNQLEKIRGEG